jgi:hypothetical protein
VSGHGAVTFSVARDLSMNLLGRNRLDAVKELMAARFAGSRRYRPTRG